MNNVNLHAIVQCTSQYMYMRLYCMVLLYNNTRVQSKFHCQEFHFLADIRRIRQGISCANWALYCSIGNQTQQRLIACHARPMVQCTCQCTYDLNFTSPVKYWNTTNACTSTCTASQRKKAEQNQIFMKGIIKLPKLCKGCKKSIFFFTLSKPLLLQKKKKKKKKNYSTLEHFCQDYHFVTLANANSWGNSQCHAYALHTQQNPLPTVPGWPLTEFPCCSLPPIQSTLQANEKLKKKKWKRSEKKKTLSTKLEKIVLTKANQFILATHPLTTPPCLTLV